MKKKIMSVILIALSAALIVGCGHRKSTQEESEAVLPHLSSYVTPSEDMFWCGVDNGEAVVLGYVGDDDYVAIPETYDGNPVTAIGPNAFSTTQVTGVLVPDTVVRIEDLAFYGCSSIEEIDCGHGLTEIGYGAFEACNRLKTVLLRNNLEHINVMAFGFCSSLEELEIPNSVRAINEQAFYKAGLKSVTIPGGVETISREAFSGCVNLISVVVSGGVCSIEEDAFSGCTELESLEIPSSVTYISQMLNGCAKVVIKSPAGSAAESFARDYGYTFVKVRTKGE